MKFKFAGALCLGARAQEVSCHFSGSSTGKQKRERGKGMGRQRRLVPLPDLRKDAPQAHQGNERRSRGVYKPPP
jgi:hypothetical protein